MANRIATSLVALALGAGVGIISTFVHRQYVLDLWVPIPLGAIAGLAITGALLIGLRLVFSSRIMAVAGAAGALVAVLILSLPGSSEPVVVVNDLLGIGWVSGILVIAALVALVPLGGRRETDSRHRAAQSTWPEDPRRAR